MSQKQGTSAGVAQGGAEPSRRRTSGAADDVDLLVELATRFYVHGESQVGIARALGINASTISRYLKRARDSGLVQVHINPPQPINLDLGRQLANHFGLSRVIVAGGGERRSLATAAADYVDGVLLNGM